MNNQRHRRFKQAVDSNNVDLFMTDIMQISQGTLDFKANSISPGTEFMYELIQHMQYFIKRKFTEDPDWKDLKVWFSPGSVPGEGEHKIMDYMRSWSQSPEYNPRDTHCIYGNDSDLVLLSLKLHLPNIIILREANQYVDKDTVVNYAAKRFVSDDPLEIIYINLLREYLYLEFAQPKIEAALNTKYKKSDFKHLENQNYYNAERMIDDFVLLSCFIGNDFLPQLYCLSTKMGHFDTLIELLRSFYIKEKKFLVFREQILWANLKLMLASLRSLEEQFIDNTQKMFKTELSRFDKKRKFLKRTDMEKMIAEKEEEEDLHFKKRFEKMKEEDKDLFLFQYKKEYKKLARASQRIDKMVELRNNRTKRREFYYYNYFSDVMEEGYQPKSVQAVDSRIGEFCRNYFEGMRFKHLYYTIGCPTWVWYYKFENCPLITDMYHYLDELEQEDLLHDQNFSVWKGSPFRPFVQLLHILPKQSLGLLPPLFEKMIFNPGQEAKFGIVSETKNISKWASAEVVVTETEEEVSKDKSEEVEEEEVTEVKEESREEKLLKRCLIGKTMQESDFTGFCFEGDEVPESMKKALDSIKCDKDFRGYFPKKFLVEASDNLKNYTWVPLIKDIDREAMKKFILSFPWNKLSKAEKLRNKMGTNKLYTYDPEISITVEPTLPGLKPLETHVKEEVLDWETLWGKDLRKIDQLYLKKEKMIEYTKFKLPSIVNSLGGLKNVEASHKLRLSREVLFIKASNQVIKDRFMNKQFENSLNIHEKIAGNKIKITPEQIKKMKVPKNKPKQNEFQNARVEVQNKMISNEMKVCYLKDYQDQVLKFVLNSHKFQKMLYTEQLFPSKMIFLRSSVVKKKEKDKIIKDMLKKLREESFIEFSNHNELFDVKDLSTITLAVPSFSMLEIKVHDVKPPIIPTDSEQNDQGENDDKPEKKQEISFSLQWKEEGVKTIPSCLLHDIIEFKTIYRLKESLDPCQPEFDLSCNESVYNGEQRPISIDVKTGDLVQLGPEAVQLLRDMQTGQRFSEIPSITDYKVIQRNFLGTDMLNISHLNDKMFPVDSTLLKDLGFRRQEKWVFWLLLDSLLLYCDKKQSSSLVLGMKFDIGLNIMNLLNKKVYDYLIVSDMVKIFLEKNYDMKTREGLQSLFDDFVYCKFLHMYLFFQDEGKHFLEKHSEKNNNDNSKAMEKVIRFVKDKYAEFNSLIKFVKFLVGKKRLDDWKRKILQLKNEGKSKKKDSFKIDMMQIESYFAIENESLFLIEILEDQLRIKARKFPPLRVEHYGYAAFYSTIKEGNFEDMELFINCLPPDLYVTLESWKVKTFSLYLSQRGLKAVKEHLKDQKDMVKGLKRFCMHTKPWTLEASHKDYFARFRIKNRFSVQEIFTDFYKNKKMKVIHSETIEESLLQSLQKQTSLETAEIEAQISKEGVIAETKEDISNKASLNDQFNSLVSDMNNQTDTEMTLNLKSMLGLVSETTPPPSAEIELPPQPESKSKNLDTKSQKKDSNINSIIEQLASQFSDKLVTGSATFTDQVTTGLKDANIKLFHCYASILKKSHSNLILQPALSRNYSIDTIKNKILKKFAKIQSKRNKAQTTEDKPIKVTHLINKTSNCSAAWPPLIKKPSYHSLGDRVVHTNPDDKDLKFGVTATVIGIYKEKIEILLDKPIIGANDLAGRVPPFRGKMMGFFDVFNLTKWKNLVYKEKHFDKVDRCWEGEYDFIGLITQIKRDSYDLKKKTYWES